VNVAKLGALAPKPLLRYLKHFEAQIEEALETFAWSLPPDALVLDAGAGEGQYKRCFARQRYVGVDLGIGDPAWNYSALDLRGDLSSLPFRPHTFDAAINIATLEHVLDPGRVLCEIGRVLKPGGRLLLVAPLEWEEHQEPHDYYRFTRYGLRHLLNAAGFVELEIRPVGGVFRLLARRLLAAAAFVPFPLDIVYLVLVVVPALLLPLLDSPFLDMDKRKNFTLGYICYARKCS
jgi:SAM-dependent methyltransferase